MCQNLNQNAIVMMAKEIFRKPATARLNKANVQKARRGNIRHAIVKSGEIGFHLLNLARNMFRKENTNFSAVPAT